MIPLALFVLVVLACSCPPHVAAETFAATYTCATVSDCSLNGHCVTSQCECDSGWTGDDCSILNLLPARSLNGYNRNKEGISSWGGRVVTDPSSPGLYHLFAAEFVNQCGLNYWSPMSRIIRAESRTGAEGPYAFVEQVVGTFAHNPTIVKGGPGWLLYHIGCDFNVTKSSCYFPDTFSCDGGTTTNGESGLTVRSATSVFGPWTNHGQVMVNNTKGLWDADTTNPSPLVFANGTVLLAYRGCGYDCESPELLAVASAKSFLGPYTRLNGGNSILPNNSGEDPFIWQDRNGYYHILFHSLEYGGGFGGPRIGRHAHSLNGVDWTFSGRHLSFNTTVIFRNGTSLDFFRRERPQLIFAEDGFTPTALISGVQERKTDQSYTFIQPIHQKRSKSATEISVTV